MGVTSDVGELEERGASGQAAAELVKQILLLNCLPFALP